VRMISAWSGGAWLLRAGCGVLGDPPVLDGPGGPHDRDELDWSL